MPHQPSQSPNTPRYPIRVVAERTGISPATLRAWEKRHRAVAPRRSGGSQRLYSESDIERLRLIAQLAADGHPLADLARHATSTLLRLARTADASGAAAAVDDGQSLRDFQSSTTVARLIAETRSLDAAALRGTLTQAVFELGPLAALDAVFTPFLAELGALWVCESIGVAHEHLASATVRDVLGWLLQNTSHDRRAPILIATTVSREQHEFGVMMAAVVAAVAGWRVIYLGPNTPSDELVRVAREMRARVLMTGVVARDVAPDLHEELLRLRQQVGVRTTLLAGGAATADHRLTFRRAQIDLIENRAALRSRLDSIWTRG